jgi:Cdc6-like AAA superfamily ATPase
MIRNAEALKHHHVPRDLVHRDGQINALASRLEPITYGDAGDSMLLTGPSGSGKTTLAKYIAEKLQRELLEFAFGYVNCQSDPTTNTALHQLLRTGQLGARRPDGTNRAHYFDILREFGGQFLGIVDEVNVLAEPGLVHGLADIPNVTLICVCVNADDLLADPDIPPGTQTRLRSMFGLELERYTHEQLMDILSYRVEHGLVSSRVDDDALAEIGQRRWECQDRHYSPPTGCDCRG